MPNIPNAPGAALPTYPPTYGIKLCPRCNNQFDDGGFAAKVYCSIRCRDAAKRQRAVARGTQAGPTVHTLPPQNIRLISPTRKQLTQHADKLHSGSLTSAVIITGLMPDWISPYADVIVNEQYGTSTKEWVMISEKMV